MIRPLPADVHEARPQAFLDQAQASAHTQRALVFRAHTHFDAMQTEFTNNEVNDKCGNEGPEASTRPLRDDPVAEHSRRHRTPVHVRHGELTDKVPINLDAENQAGSFAMIPIRATHVL